MAVGQPVVNVQLQLELARLTADINAKLEQAKLSIVIRDQIIAELHDFIAKAQPLLDKLEKDK